VLARWLATEEFPDRLLDEAPAHAAAAVEIVYGVVRRRRELEWVLDRLADRRPDRALLAHVLAGLYEILHMEETPAHAAVHEAVESVKEALSAREARFTNAVLRRALRERDGLLAALADQPAGIRLSHPDALLARWRGQFGEAAAVRLCEWDNGRAETIVRVSAAAGGAAAYRQRLREAGIEAEPHPARPESCLVLPRGARVTELPGYADGAFVVQDPSGMAAVDLLDPRPGETVLDGCAAPGGKASLIAERMRGEGRLVASDLHADRVARLRENLARVGANWVEVAQADLAAGAGERATALGAAGAAAGFDAVLLDVPCSNTGVLRRRPDAKWRFSQERLERLCGLQASLLRAGAGLVAPGGRLVYSTCSLEREENEDAVERFLAENQAFERAGAVRLVPPDSGTDGAYAALLARRR
jgi:16S rRNA (cytosine967-C5)-methyltransferase